MNKHLTLVSVSILMLALLLPACGSASEEVPATSTPIPSTPTPEAIELSYINAALGVSMWYPDTWVYEEDQAVVTFGSSQEAVHAEDLETGAVFSVRGQDLEGDQVEDVVEMIVQFLGSGAEMEVTDSQPRAIGGQGGIVASFEGTPVAKQFPVRGFVAGVEREGWGYVFIAASALDDWPDYGPDMEAMLDTVQLSGLRASTHTPTPTVITAHRLVGEIYMTLSGSSSGRRAVRTAVIVTGGDLEEEGRRVTTDAEGRYEVSDLVPGPYEVFVSLSGATQNPIFSACGVLSWGGDWKATAAGFERTVEVWEHSAVTNADLAFNCWVSGP